MGTMLCFIIFGVLFIILGIVLVTMSNGIVEYVVDYTDCALPTGDPVFGKSVECTKTFEITADIPGKVLQYYQLTNFYQNHRRYVKSRSYRQLMGEAMTVDQISTDCSPIVTNADLAPYITKAVDGKTALVGTEPANPCGLIAKSLFTDRYTLMEDGQALTANTQGIAWQSDIDYKFKRLDAANWNTIQWADVTNEHFIVWMRTAGLPNFRKLNGYYENGLKAGTHTLKIQNAYDVTKIKGTKAFVLSTTNALGGANFFLAYTYIVVGVVSLVFAVVFALAYKRRQG